MDFNGDIGTHHTQQNKLIIQKKGLIN